MLWILTRENYPAHIRKSVTGNICSLCSNTVWLSQFALGEWTVGRKSPTLKIPQVFMQSMKYETRNASEGILKKNVPSCTVCCMHMTSLSWISTVLLWIFIYTYLQTAQAPSCVLKVIKGRALGRLFHEASAGEIRAFVREKPEVSEPSQLIKALATKPDNPEFDPCNQHGRRRERIPESCLLTMHVCTQTLAMHACMHTHMHQI